MDTRFKDSQCLYYAFGCFQDTCATHQIAKRTFLSLGNQLDSFTSYPICWIGTGSMYEGISVESSDLDLMSTNIMFKLYPIGYNGEYDSTKFCLQMKRKNHTRPGYCLVDDVSETHGNLDFNLRESARKLYKSYESQYSDHLDFYLKDSEKKYYKSNESQYMYDRVDSSMYKKPTSTGPAFTAVLTDSDLSTDSVTCFESKIWPTECRNWSQLITWPSVSLQDAIRREGFHIVKVGHPLSPDKDKEWRLSFSVAEKMLIATFNPTQLTCAVVMKWLVNHYIKPVVPDSINSYHIKTLMLWSIEQDTDQKWEPQYFIQCLQYLLKNLILCIFNGKLQHYFIPDNNILECKITNHNKEILLKEVLEIRFLIVDKCRSLLRIVGVTVPPSEALTYMVQEYSLRKVAFKYFRDCKSSLNTKFVQSCCHFMKPILKETLLNNTSLNQHELCLSLLETIVKFSQWELPTLNKEAYVRLSNKCFSYFKTWCCSILIAVYKSKRMENNHIIMDAIGKYLLTRSYENASTTGCIKMALGFMCEGDHYLAVPLLNRSLNIIDQFDNYRVTSHEECSEYNFTQYMHLYNDQQAIESALTMEFLKDKMLCETLFIWLEINLLPSLLQLELTHSFYKVDILATVDNLREESHPFQYWNPIPVTHFLLFICHYELLKLATFLDPACLQEDITNLKCIIHDRQRLNQDEVPAVINLLTWCYLKIGDNKSMVEYAVKCVQQSTACDKTLFSHMFIQHVIGGIFN